MLVVRHRRDSGFMGDGNTGPRAFVLSLVKLSGKAIEAASKRMSGSCSLASIKILFVPLIFFYFFRFSTDGGVTYVRA